MELGQTPLAFSGDEHLTAVNPTTVIKYTMIVYGNMLLDNCTKLDYFRVHVTCGKVYLYLGTFVLILQSTS